MKKSKKTKFIILDIIILIIVLTFPTMISLTILKAQDLNSCFTLNDSNYELSRDLISKVNEYRVKNGVKPLIINTDQQQMAAHKAYDYAKFRVWSHDLNGEVFDQIYRECSTKYSGFGENLAKGFVSADRTEDILNAWIESPEHNANLINKDYKYIGMYMGDQNMDFYTVATFAY